MSDLSNEALSWLQAGDIAGATRLASVAVGAHPDDFHAHYVLGQCFRFRNEYGNACRALVRANELAPRQPEILLALGIARQLDGQFTAALAAFADALDVDPDYATAFNSLAMTRKMMGDYAEAAEDYDRGVKALARKIMQSLVNAEDAPRHPHTESRNNLWLEYALYGAVHSCSSDPSIENVAFPDGEMAERDARTGYLRGWYWQDEPSAEGKGIRLFLPNFLNTFARELRASRVYADLIGNRGTVLEQIGRHPDARRHIEEAEDFDA